MPMARSNFGMLRVVIWSFSTNYERIGCSIASNRQRRTMLRHRQTPAAAIAAGVPTNNFNKDIAANIRFDTKSTRANSLANDEQAQQIPQQIVQADDNPYGIYSIKLCCDGKYLIAAGRGGHVTLFKFTGSELEKADEGLGDLACLEIPIFHRNVSNDNEILNSSSNSSYVNDLQSLTLKQNAERKGLTLLDERNEWTSVDALLGISKFVSSKNGLSTNGRLFNLNWFVYFRGSRVTKFPFWPISPSIRNTDCKVQSFDRVMTRLVVCFSRRWLDWSLDWRMVLSLWIISVNLFWWI